MLGTVPIISANYNNSPTMTIKSNVTLTNLSENMNMTPHSISVLQYLKRYFDNK